MKELCDKLDVNEYVLPERAFIVGSSSMAKSTHKDVIVATVKGKLARIIHPVDFVTANQEATFGFQGVLGMLPHRWRKLRQTQAAVIDIGSGNIKAAFMTGQGSEGGIVTLGIDEGTKRATDEINQLRGELEFRQAADKWRKTAFVPALRAQLDSNPGLGNRNRIYLIGGIVWAMVNLEHPDDRSKFPQIRPSNIDSFLKSISAPDGTAKLCSDENKAKYLDVSKACDTFSSDNLVAGTELLKGLSDELGFVKSRKNLSFFANLSTRGHSDTFVTKFMDPLIHRFRFDCIRQSY